MAKSKFHVGLEIGTTTTRIAVAEVKPDQSVKILALGESKSAGVRKGEIQDFKLTKACIRATLLEAEDHSNIQIGRVYLAVTGGHFRGFNNRGTYRLPDDNTQIEEGHVIEVEDIACDTNIPADNVCVHTLVRRYMLDGKELRASPVGLIGKTLEADFHIVHGIKSRIQNAIKVVQENSLSVEDIVFSPIASAQIAVNREKKQAGALVVDIGGGTSDYALYISGALFASGCIPIGGDHITNDIHLVTHIPLSKAEKLKVEHGDVSGSPESLEGMIEIEDELGLDNTHVERRVLNQVISYRLKEIFTILTSKLPEGVVRYIGTGVHLTGGVSKTIGISTVVNELFPIPVYYPETSDLSGTTAYFKDPQLFTVLGLIRYAQILEQEESPPPVGPLNFFSKLLGK